MAVDPGHPFYAGLNEVLDGERFDPFVEKLCSKFYADKLGRPGLARGIETPTREDLARLDRKRNKRTSNKEWKSPTDRDARVAKMKDGSTYLAHKAGVPRPTGYPAGLVRGVEGRTRRQTMLWSDGRN
jgi:hypothetical protein